MSAANSTHIQQVLLSIPPLRYKKY